MKQTTARARAERCIPANILKQYKDVIEKVGTPLYIYDAGSIRNQIKTIENAMPKGTHIHVAAFSNELPPLMELCDRQIPAGGMMCDSIEEVQLLRTCTDVEPNRMLFTGSGLSREEISFLVSNRIYVNLDSPSQIAIFASEGGTECGLRVRLDVEPPPNTRVSAIGKQSPIGVPEQKVVEVLEGAQEAGVQITGLHIYPGTNILDYREHLRIFDYFLGFVEKLPDKFKEGLQTINLGGGFGVDYSGNQEFDFKAHGKGMTERLRSLKQTVKIAIEPGRSVLATAGVLMAKVTDVKEDGTVNVNSSCAHFARYWVYGQEHFITAIEKLDWPLLSDAVIKGDTTLTLDVLGKAKLQQVQIGDILVVAQAGAYGYSMSSNYLGKLKPAVVLLDGEDSYLIARRQTVEDLARLSVRQRL